MRRLRSLWTPWKLWEVRLAAQTRKCNSSACIHKLVSSHTQKSLQNKGVQGWGQSSFTWLPPTGPSHESSALQAAGGRGPFPYISPWPHLLQGRMGHVGFILVGQGPANIRFLDHRRGPGWG